MTGYCSDCGNTMCLCGENAREVILNTTTPDGFVNQMLRKGLPQRTYGLQNCSVKGCPWRDRAVTVPAEPFHDANAYYWTPSPLCVRCDGEIGHSTEYPSNLEPDV